ncbi:hypothetical protein PNK_0613 [Candidatus Protochlamydia naegleriophila]|uniref:Uncharacterized protein n=2 Tax=Candidatus Protochlamydia naegleriophila TaxID=389348 RepID=A0A0U5EQ39_9BACT|nr:hypothetical protein PNK_0613 [Candidatus Protochlamydia naegleriophila]
MSSSSSLGSSLSPVIIHDTSPKTSRSDTKASKSPRSCDSTPRGTMLSPRSIFGAIVRSPVQSKTPEKDLNLTDRATFNPLSEEDEKKFQKLIVYILHKCIDKKHWSARPQSKVVTTFSPSIRSESFFKQTTVSTASVEVLPSPRSARESRTPRKSSISKSKLMDESKLAAALKKCWAKLHDYFPYPKSQSSAVISNGELRTRLQGALGGYLKSETVELVKKTEELFQKLAKANDTDQQVVTAKEQMLQAISESVRNSIVHYHALCWIEQHMNVMEIKYFMGLKQVESDPLSSAAKLLLATKFKEFANAYKDFGMEFLLFVQQFERIEDPLKALILLEYIEKTYLPTETLSNFLEGNPKEINVDLAENVITLKRIKEKIQEFKTAREKGETFVIPANLFTEDFKIEIIGGLEKNFIKTQNRNFFYSEAWQNFEHAMYKMKP